MESYLISQLIGSGQFSKVYSAKHISSGKRVALKLVPKDCVKKDEVLTHRSLSKHKNIVKLLACFQTLSEICFVTEFCNTDLQSYLLQQPNGKLAPSTVARVCRGLVEGLEYIHSKGFIHRDLKLQNILLAPGASDRPLHDELDESLVDSNIVVKIGDFGFAKACTTSLSSIKGTPIYMAPELILEQPYNHKIDLWSLGIILFEIYTGLPPFNTTNIFQLVDMVLNDEIQYPQDMPALLLDLLQHLLKKEPGPRIDWPDLALHSYLDSEDEFNLINDIGFDDEIISDDGDGAKKLERLDSGIAMAKSRDSLRNSFSSRANSQASLRKQDTALDANFENFSPQGISAPKSAVSSRPGSALNTTSEVLLDAVIGEAIPIKSKSRQSSKSRKSVKAVKQHIVEQKSLGKMSRSNSAKHNQIDDSIETLPPLADSSRPKWLKNPVNISEMLEHIMKITAYTHRAASAQSTVQDIIQHITDMMREHSTSSSIASNITLTDLTPEAAFHRKCAVWMLNMLKGYLDISTTRIETSPQKRIYTFTRTYICILEALQTYTTIAHFDILVQVFLPIVGRLVATEGGELRGPVYALVLLLLRGTSGDVEYTRDIDDLRVFETLIANIGNPITVDIVKSVIGCLTLDYGASIKVFLRLDATRFTEFCEFIVTAFEMDDSAIVCSCASLLYEILQRSDILVQRASEINSLVKALIEIGDDDYEVWSISLKICGLLCKANESGWCLDRIHALAQSLWSPGVDVFDQNSVEQMIPIDSCVVDLIYALPVHLGILVLSATGESTLARLQHTFEQYFSVRRADDLFNSMICLYEKSGHGVIAQQFSQWVLRIMWDCKLESDNNPSWDLETILAMVKCINANMNMGKAIFDLVSLKARDWVLSRKGMDGTYSHLYDSCDVYLPVIKSWLSPGVLCNAQNRGAGILSCMVGHIAAGIYIMQTKLAQSFIPTLVYAFPILNPADALTVFAVLCNTLLQSIVYEAVDQLDILASFLYHKNADEIPNMSHNAPRKLVTNHQWEHATTAMWALGTRGNVNDALDLILGLVDTGKCDRYVIEHCHVSELLSIHSDPPVRARILGLMCLPLFADNRLVEYSTLTECLRNARCWRWACQYISTLIARGDIPAREFVAGSMDLFCTRSMDCMLGKLYAVLCLAGTLQYADELAWFSNRIGGHPDAAFRDFALASLPVVQSRTSMKA